jgi:predicted O-methyltransferase YrrM
MRWSRNLLVGVFCAVALYYTLMYMQPSPVQTPQEHLLLEVLLESITEQYVGRGYPDEFLKTRAWAGNSHIGIRPPQFKFVYDLARRLRPKTSCEIGLNGGHSAAILLSAAGPNAKLVSFDLHALTYSSRAQQFLERLFPRQIEWHVGDSIEQVPLYVQNGGAGTCDLFVIDGDHSFEGVKNDLLNALRATRKGGVILLDDMNVGSGSRRAFDEVAKEHFQRVECGPEIPYRVPYYDRSDLAGPARDISMAWCWAVV